MKPCFLTLLALALTFTVRSHVSGEEITSPDELVKKVQEHYHSLDTYRSEGTVVTEFEMQGQQMSVETKFSMHLKKPNLYRIAWEQTGMPMPDMSQAGAVWSDGTERFLFLGMMNAYSRMESDELALGAATGISSGAAYNVPSLFFTGLEELEPPLHRLKDPQLEASEKVGDEECYVLGGQSLTSKREVLWISKKDFSVRKFSQSLEAPEGGRQLPEMSEQEVEQVLESMGRPVTDESKEELRSMMEESHAALADVEMTGTIVELHEKISSPELDQADFVFEVPQGTQLRDSLFDGDLPMSPTP